MTSILSSSQGMVLATTAVLVSGTFILFSFLRDKNFQLINSTPPLRSCFSNSSGAAAGINKKKKVRFAEDVKEPNGNSEEFRKKFKKHRSQAVGHGGCRTKTDEAAAAYNYNNCSNNNNNNDQINMPANRMALYDGILRDRSRKIVC